VSVDYQYITNDVNYGNIVDSKIVNLSSSVYLVVSAVEVSSANHYTGGYIMLTILNAVNGAIFNSKVIRIPDVPGIKIVIGGVALTGNTVYVTGIGGSYAFSNNQVFVVKASVSSLNNLITPNWVRSYYTPALYDGPKPSIVFDNQSGRVVVSQPDDNGKVMLFSLNSSNGSIFNQNIFSLPGKKIKEARLGFTKVGTATYRTLVTRSEDNNTNSYLTVCKMDAFWNIGIQKTYQLTNNLWELGSADFQQTNILIGASNKVGSIRKYNWLQFDAGTCNNTSNKSYTQPRDGGLSILTGGTVFSLGLVASATGPKLIEMFPSTLCEAGLSTSNVTATMAMAGLTLSNGMNIANPIMNNILILKMNGTSTASAVCP
jgi:hypothetical protein